MSKWPKLRVAEVAAPKGLVGGPFGSSLGTKDYVPQGIPVIRGVNLNSQNRFNSSEFVFVTPEKVARDLSRNTAEPGDVVFTQRGTLGQVGIIPPHPYKVYVISQSQMRLRVNTNIALPEFVYYHFRSPKMVDEIHRRAITTGVPHINLGILGELEISIPPLRIQQVITDFLGALDDKIAVNDRIAATTRHLALTWFSAALKNEAQDVELSEITSALVRGVAPKYSEDVTALTVLNQKCVRDGRVNLDPARRTLREKVREPKFLQRYDVLVNSTGVGTLGRVAIWDRDDEATADSHVTIVRFDVDKVDPLCAGLAMLRAQPDIELLGEGSTGQTELSRKQLNAYRITLPSKEAMRELRPKLDALEARGKAALDESNALAALRDTLLPKLMSGEIRVRDAERAVEDAV